MSKPDRSSWENFSDYLISQGLRMTGQRKAVFDALFRQSGHFTADQLLQDAREMDDSVSLCNCLLLPSPPGWKWCSAQD